MMEIAQRVAEGFRNLITVIEYPALPLLVLILVYAGFLALVHAKEKAKSHAVHALVGYAIIKLADLLASSFSSVVGL